MNSIPSIPEITGSSFDRHVLCSELPVLVLFCAAGEAAGRHLLSWLSEWTPQTSSLLNIVQVSCAEARTLAARWGIPSVPSLAVFYAGSVRYQFCGQFSRRELDEVLTRAALLSLSSHLAAPSEQDAGVQQPRARLYE